MIAVQVCGRDVTDAVVGPRGTGAQVIEQLVAAGIDGHDEDAGVAAGTAVAVAVDDGPAPIVEATDDGGPVGAAHVGPARRVADAAHRR